MTHHTLEMIPVGNNHVFDNDEEFSSGFLNGHSYYYDTNTQLPRPLTCQAIHAFMKEHLSDPMKAKAGMQVLSLAGSPP